MGMSANLHGACYAKADVADSGTSWLTITNDKGDRITVFMPFDTALRMALAFNDATATVDHPEDYDDGNITP